MVRLCLLLFASLIAARPAAASTFNISPIRAELSQAKRTEVLTLTNADDQPVVVQVRLLAWSQQNGEEQLDETRDLLVTPPVLQIAAGSEQIVRVALRREPDANRELTYRVVFEEVPQAAPANFTGLRVALRLSIPVFVAPSSTKAAAALAWAARPLGDGRIEVSAVNRGSAHLQITDFELQPQDAARPWHGTTAKYVLPGSRMIWTLKPDAVVVGGAARAQALISTQGPFLIHGRSDQGPFSADVALSGL